MTLQEFAKLVAELRHCQREYFRTMNPFALEQSKRLEREVDKRCAEILDGQGKLFE